jgi:hypothetical protein
LLFFVLWCSRELIDIFLRNAIDLTSGNSSCRGNERFFFGRVKFEFEDIDSTASIGRGLADWRILGLLAFRTWTGRFIGSLCSSFIAAWYSSSS